MASFGENLRQARKARNMTLQDISASTKIGTRALQALEDEHFDVLPGGIFNKGFVRSYARCVGLDEEKTLAGYLAAAKVAAPETDMQAWSTQVSAAREERSPWRAVSAGAIASVLAMIVALGLGALWLKEQRKEARESAEQRRVENPVAAAPVTVPPQAVAPAASDPNSVPSQSASQVEDPATVATAAPLPSSTGTAQVGAMEPAMEPASPVEISISATARAWISVRSDGKPVESLTLDPANPETRTRSYKAREKLLLIVGNPAGLSVTYNGKPVGTLGAEGRRAMVTFTPQGIEKQ